MKMERVEPIVPRGVVTYEITDGTGHTAQLSSSEALDLLKWLDSEKSQIFRDLYPEKGEIRVNPLDVFPAIEDLDEDPDPDEL